MKFFIYLYYCLLLFSWSFANAQQEIKIIGSNNSILGTVDYIQENRFYFSLNDFSDILLKKNFVNTDLQKIVFSIGNNKVKVTGNIPFVIINDKPYQLKNTIIYKKGVFYAPIDDFLELLNKKIGSQYFMNYNSLSISAETEINSNQILTDLNKIKEKLEFDTIIIDPGHGGKDPGAIGYRGTKEKDIALDVSKRLAKKIERNSKTKVILTREEDVFVRLQDRTKFANANKGDLFISIHTNAAKDRRASGFETFLIGIGKNEEAIRVAARENAVLELEGVGDATKLTDEALIQATVSQSGFANLSEQFAALVQEEIDKRVQSKNSGVKQAGFYVLMGASMPNVLIELGFISNPNEEKKLNSSSYRDMLATSIYYAVLKYQKSFDD